MRRVLFEQGVSEQKLCEALADRPDDRDSRPRSLVKSWLEGTRTVSPISAFRAGEALRTLGVGWSNGPSALFASGHYAEFVKTVRALWLRGDAEAGELACGLLSYCEFLADYDLYGGVPYSRAHRMEPANAKVAKTMEIVQHLPEYVASIRNRVTHALSVHGAEIEQLVNALSASEVEGPAELRKIDQQVMRPAIQLLSSGSRPALMWRATRVILRQWLLDATPPVRVEQPTAALDLWGEVPILLTGHDGDEVIHVYSRPPGEEDDLVQAMDFAISIERYAPLDDVERTT